MNKFNFNLYKTLFNISLKFKYRFQFLADFLEIKKNFSKDSRRDLFWQIIKKPTEAEDWLNIKRFLADLDDLILIDIGANIGKFTQTFNKYFNPKISYCYEPIKSTFKELEFNTRELNVVLINEGISDKKRKIKMRIGNDSTLNSIHKFQENFIISGERERQENEVEALFNTIKDDEICKGNIFLKIDVQGMEENSLKGCKEIMPRVNALLIETSFVSEYENVRPSFAHICKDLIKYDLYPICFQSYGTKNNIYPYERDVLFVRQNLLEKIFR